jgi:DNA repair exonuclease SbcCD ATPase subunit
MKEKEDRLFIIGLEVENFKRINLVKIFPNDTGLTVIGGDNAQGKSSLLDATMAALAGERSVPARPIKDGAKKGLVKVDLSNGLEVRRSFTEKGGGLTVLTKDGHRVTSPQKALDNPFGGIGFDPLKFIDVKTPKEEREQMQMLLDALGLDFSDIDEQKEKAFEDRTVVNREVKRLDGAISKMPHWENVPENEVSLTELTKKFEEANEMNATIQAKGDRISYLDSKVEELNAEIRRLDQETSDAMAESKTLRAELTTMEEQDIEAIRLKMSTIEEDNQKVRSNNERRKLESELEGKKAESEVLTKELGGIEDKKRKMISEADIPIDGLDFADEGLLYKKVPLKQASSSEKVAVAIALADILSPKSRVVLIREGSNLDPKTLMQIAVLSREKGLQVIMERVSKGPEVDVVIEDGRVEGNST